MQEPGVPFGCSGHDCPSPLTLQNIVQCVSVLPNIANVQNNGESHEALVRHGP